MTFSDLSMLNDIEFPPRESFYNKLEDKECSMKDYLHGKFVWNMFECKTFREYHDLYHKNDVLLLADFFEKFRRTCMDSYGLNSAHYYSAPGIAWNAALKITGVRLDLFDNEEMYTFIERSIRGGISQISKGFAKTNTKYCPDYDPTKPIHYLIYRGANNHAHGWAMSQYLPTKNFRWLTQEEIVAIAIHLLDDEADTGYMFEIDIKYPQWLHDLHNSYTLAPERLTIDESLLSPFQTECFRVIKINRRRNLHRSCATKQTILCTVDFLKQLGTSLDIYLSKYDNILLLGDFNTESTCYGRLSDHHKLTITS